MSWFIPNNNLMWFLTSTTFAFSCTVSSQRCEELEDFKRKSSRQLSLCPPFWPGLILFRSAQALAHYSGPRVSLPTSMLPPTLGFNRFDDREPILCFFGILYDSTNICQERVGNWERFGQECYPDWSTTPNRTPSKLPVMLVLLLLLSFLSTVMQQ